MGALHRIGGLVGEPVAIGDVRLGVAVDALFDRQLTRLVGFDISCGDGAHRFLPFPACELRGGRIAVESALVFLDRELDFYRAEGSAFSDLEGQEVSLGGDRIGLLADLLVDPEGKVGRVVVSAPDGRVELEPEARLVVGSHVLRPAV